MKSPSIVAVCLCAALNASAASTSSYVQDGLIACWDGIENAGAGTHDAGATVWKDIVGGYEFALTGVTVDDDRMTFAGSTSSYGTLSAADTTSSFVVASNGTMEIVYRSDTGAGTQVLLQSTDSSGLAFGIFSGNNIILRSSSSTAAQMLPFTSGANTNCVSVFYTSRVPVSAVVNGGKMALSGSNYWGSPGTTTVIGKRASNASGFLGSIYCIRLYNRHLSDEEIAANYEIDQKRFIFQVDESTLQVSSSVEGIASSPSPAYGLVSGLSAGAAVPATCGHTEVTNSNGSVYSCTGWKLYNENDAVVSNGTGSAFTYVHPTPAAYRKLEWQWEITSPPTRYVQDGLVACWDGIENAGAGVHEDNVAVWKDLVAGREFTLADVTVDANCMTFAGSTSSYGTLSATDTASTFLAAKSGTLEIVYRSRTGTGSQVIMQSTGAAGMAFSIWETSKILPYTSSSQAAQLSFSFTSGTETNLVAVRYVSGAPVTAIANGSALSPANASSWASPGSETIIGNRYTKASANVFPGSIYAIRLYDRQLTDPEILANQSIDRQRFSPEVDNSRLVVSSTLDGLGAPSPAYGYLTGLAAGETHSVTCGSATILTNAAGNVVYVCSGWKLYDKDDRVVDSGSDIAFTYEHPSPAAYRRLEWHWEVSEVKGTIAAGANGSVSSSGTAWFAADTPVTVTATPDANYAFAQWSGTIPNGIDASSASITFTPTAPFDMTADFSSPFYVATTGDDADPGTEAAPFATISNAIEKAKLAIAGGSTRVTIFVAVGTYTETGLVLDGPIAVVGASRDHVEIVDDVVGFRAFTLSHADAVVRNLTISGNGLRLADGQGAHLWMSDGLVENCVIKDGRTSPSSNRGYGGNVWMSGGRLTRCLITGGKCNWGGWPGSNKYSYGMGIYATGGIIDNCWFKDNKVEDANSASWYGVYLNGAVRLVNCLVTGGASYNKGEGVGVYVANANATVANCVFCDNGDNSADANFGKANLNRFFNCAAPAANASCATWKVITSDDFAEYAAGNYEPIPGSQLVDAGDVAYCPANATLDLDGNARVSGASVDIGCWELGQSQFSCGGYPSSYAALENANVTFHATVVGPASDVVFRWNYGNGTIENTREAAHVYAYPAAGYFTVKLAASPDGGSTWTDWYTVPTRVVVAPQRMYVDSKCATPAYPYKTRETAAATLEAVLTSLTNNVSENLTCVDGVDVVILSGSVLNDTGHLIASAVTVRGETGNPADVEIVDNTVGFRAFTLSHPDAVVSNLTISGNGLRIHSGHGGHIWMSAGLVANCVIKDGNASPAQGRLGNGGNVWMSGGRLERCLVTGGKCSSGGWPGSNSSSYGMALYASGGTIDSCFFKDNKVPDTNSDSHGGVCLYGSARLLNCTITGGESFRDGNGTGVRVSSANAMVVNCVLYGNGNNSADANLGTSNLNRFYYCGSSVTNSQCATWTVLTDEDFVDFPNGNLHQKRYSELIDHGTTDTTYRPADSVTLDLDGHERVSGRSIDLGCWEILSGIGSVYILR
ncbi:MAG: right-handed parallel beta-helix repeat-containing protein [Kiritimatiellae bacterium]|nr:right-handed parallel beta-helix repeat-containing protein [Kiritimatiellia bacterium]